MNWAFPWQTQPRNKGFYQPRKSIPSSQKIQKQYPEINFIFLSKDEDYKNWENSILSKKLDKENNYLIGSSKNSEILKYFKITSISRYVIIGKDGKVVYQDAPRPSDPKIRKVFDDLLKE